jgi:hypothetical protein
MRWAKFWAIISQTCPATLPTMHFPPVALKGLRYTLVGYLAAMSKNYN